MIFLLLHLLVTTTGSCGSPAYSPPDHILHNCGGASEQDSNGRNWTSDAYYPECLPPNEPDKSVTFKAKAAAAAGSASVLDIPYRSVHIFVNQCTRSYTVSPGPKFIRLHFSPTIHYFVHGFNRKPEDSFFSVSANEHTLLANFSAFRTADFVDVVVKEYIVNVDANRLNIVGGVAGGVAVVVIVILVFLVNFRRRLTRDSATNVTSSSSSKTLEFAGQSELCRHFSLDELKSATNVTSSSSSKTLEFAGQSELCRQFSLDELKSATADFDESYVIGKGGFGKVYRASINKSDEANSNSSIVAVKRLNKAESRQGEKEFWMEIKMLSNLRNQNLVPLNGYCNEDQEMLLVYEYMAGGTLANHLYKIDDDIPSLSWEQRLNICLGAARGLQYLHGANVIHRDVKSTNILLDESLVAKISDFGLSKTGPGNDSFSHIPQT